MIECPLESENTNHIGKALSISQPAVFRSMHLLEKENYIRTEQEFQRGRRRLMLTDKGVAAALFSGTEKDKIHSYLQRRAPSSLFLLLINVLHNKKDLDTEIMRLNIEYMFCQDREKYESDEKRKMKLVFTLMVGLCRDYIDGKKLGSFLKRDERIRLIEMLRTNIKSTNSIIDQLNSDEPKEDIKPMIVFRPPFKGKDLWKMDLSRPTPTKIQKDTNNEMVFEIYRTNLSVWSELLKKTQSDQLRLSVNKADGNISVIPIPKST